MCGVPSTGDSQGESAHMEPVADHRPETTPRRRYARAGAALVAVVLAGTGCSSTPAGEAFQPEYIEADRSLIYIYRPVQSFAPPAVLVVIDQSEVGELGQGEYLVCAVEPGERLVRVEGRSSVVQPVRLVEGESAFIEVRTPAFDDKVYVERPQVEDARERITRTGRAGRRR